MLISLLSIVTFASIILLILCLKFMKAKNHLERENQALREETVKLGTTLDMNKNHHETQIKLLNDAKEKLQLEFKELAQTIFDEKNKQFKANTDEQLQHLLNPLKEQIKTFEHTVKETHEKETKAHHALNFELKELKNLNKNISEEAHNLTEALRGKNKTQGMWGEAVLERMLELSGLENGREYETQRALSNEEHKTLYPDVIVHLPNERDIIIDSKVSLTAYQEYVNAETEESKKEQLKLHIQSVKQHVKNLSGKEYQQLKQVSSLDFVLLFLPIDEAYSLVVNNEPKIYQEALHQNIIIVTPSSLLACLRTIENLWRMNSQNNNAIHIAERAGALYDKFVAFLDDMQDVGKRLDTTQKSFDAALNKLHSGKGNLIRRTEELKKMGAKASKKLDAKMLQLAEESEDE